MAKTPTKLSKGAPKGRVDRLKDKAKRALKNYKKKRVIKKANKTAKDL